DIRGGAGTLSSDGVTGADHPPHRSAPGTDRGSLRPSAREYRSRSVHLLLRVAPVCARHVCRSSLDRPCASASSKEPLPRTPPPAAVSVAPARNRTAQLHSTRVRAFPCHA